MPSTISLNTIPAGAQGVTNFVNNIGLSNNTIYASTLREIITNTSFPGLFAPTSIDSSKLAPVPGNKLITRSLSGSKNIASGGQIAWYSIDTLDIADQAINNRTIASGTINVDKFSATGTRNNNTYLRGDNRWETIPIIVPQSGTGISVQTTDNIATISVNLATLNETTGTTPPTNKTISAKTLIDVLDSSLVTGKYVTLGTNQTITGTKTFNQPIVGDITGNAATATNADTAKKLATARSIALGGLLTGSANFDGSAGITINAASTTLDAVISRVNSQLASSVLFVPVNFSTRSNASVPIIPGVGNNYWPTSSGTWWKQFTGSTSTNPWWTGTQTTNQFTDAPANTVAVLVQIILNGNVTANSFVSLYIRKNSSEPWNSPADQGSPAAAGGTMTDTVRNNINDAYMKMGLDPSSPDWESEYSITLPVYIDTSAKTFQWFVLDAKNANPVSAPVYAVRMDLLGYYVAVT